MERFVTTVEDVDYCEPAGGVGFGELELGAVDVGVGTDAEFFDVFDGD